MVNVYGGRYKYQSDTFNDTDVDSQVKNLTKVVKLKIKEIPKIDQYHPNFLNHGTSEPPIETTKKTVENLQWRKWRT